MKNISLVTSIGLISVIILAACGGTSVAGNPTPIISTNPTPTGAPITALRAALLGDISSTNVWCIFDVQGASVWNSIVEGGYWPTLFGLSPQHFDLIPNAARELPASFSQEGDFYTNTVSLKENLQWSDGSAVTADDVAFTINTVLLFKLGMNWKMFYDPNFLDHVEAIDPLTVKFYFKQMLGLAKWQYGVLQGVFVNKAFWEPRIIEAMATLGDSTNEDSRVAAVNQLESLDATGEPTFGPYKLDQRIANTSLSNVINNNYFFNGVSVEEYNVGDYHESKPDGSYEWVTPGTSSGDLSLQYLVTPYNTIDFTIHNSDQAYLALRNNSVDVVINPAGIGIGTISQLQIDPNIQIVSNPQNGTAFIAFNQNHIIFSGEGGLALRKMLACLMDLNALSKGMLQNQGTPAYSLVPSVNSFWMNPSVYKYCDKLSTEERYTQAIQYLLLQQFKWLEQMPWYNAKAPSGSNLVAGKGLTLPDGSTFPTLTILAPNSASDPLLASMAENIAETLKNLDFPVVVEHLNISELISVVYQTGDYDMALLNPGFSYYPSYLCSLFNEGMLPNPFGYQSDVLNEKCIALARENDINRAKTVAFDIQNILATDIPIITLYSPIITDAFRNFTVPYTTSIDGLTLIYNPHPIQQVITFR